MLGVINVAARAVLAVLEHRTVIAVEATAVAIAHPVFLTIDRMLLMLDAMRLAGGHTPAAQPLIDAVLLVGMALIDRLRLRGAGEHADAEGGGKHAMEGLHGISPQAVDGEVLRTRG
jgi:hypothetical protein